VERGRRSGRWRSLHRPLRRHGQSDTVRSGTVSAGRPRRHHVAHPSGRPPGDVHPAKSDPRYDLHPRSQSSERGRVGSVGGSYRQAPVNQSIDHRASGAGQRRRRRQQR
jgi:hypothetical protein